MDGSDHNSGQIFTYFDHFIWREKSVDVGNHRQEKAGTRGCHHSLWAISVGHLIILIWKINGFTI